VARVKIAASIAAALRSLIVASVSGLSALINRSELPITCILRKIRATPAAAKGRPSGGGKAV
jgi:hypothetical protein